MTDAKQKKLGIEKLTCSYRFSLVSQLRHSITEVITDNFDEIGYIEPGHGMKGKKLWITRDDDLKEMYDRYNKNILQKYYVLRLLCAVLVR